MTLVQVITLDGPASRERAMEAIAVAPRGSRVAIVPPGPEGKDPAGGCEIATAPSSANRNGRQREIFSSAENPEGGNHPELAIWWVFFLRYSPAEVTFCAFWRFSEIGLRRAFVSSRRTFWAILRSRFDRLPSCGVQPRNPPNFNSPDQKFASPRGSGSKGGSFPTRRPHGCRV